MEQNLLLLNDSALIIKLLSSLAIAALFFFGDSKRFLPLLLIAGACLLRDAVFFFVPSGAIFLAGDVLVIAFFATLVTPYKLNKGPMTAILSLTGLFFLADAVFAVMGASIPRSLVQAGAYLPWEIPLLALSVLAVGLAANRKPGALVSLPALVAASGFFFAYGIAGVALGVASQPFQWIAAPLVLLLALFIVLAETKDARDRHSREMGFRDETLGAVDRFIKLTDKSIKSSQAIGELLDILNRSILDELKADGSIFLLVDEIDDIIEVKSYQGRYPPPFKLPAEVPRKPNRIELFIKHARLNVGETVLGEVARDGKAVFVPAAKDDPRIADNGSDDFLRIGSFIAVPLISGDRIMGVLSLTRKSADDPFAESDFQKSQLFADFASLAINSLFSFIDKSEKRNIEHEASIAADIQKTLLPKKLPELSFASFGSFASPAKQVCSDYHDVILVRKNHVAIVMGDVAGKGISASLVMVMLRSILHLIANSSRDSATILNWVNRGITGRVDLDHFATLSYASFDAETGTLEYSNASHPPMLVYRAATKEVETVELKSLPIGVEKKTEYTQKKLRLADGDVVILFTDGVVEAMNADGKQYGMKALVDCVQRNGGGNPRDLASKLKAEVQKFVGDAKQHDDQSFLAMKAKLS